MGTESDPNFTVAAGPAFPPFRERELGSPLSFVTSRVHDAGNGVNLDQIRLHNPFGLMRLERSTPAWIRTKDQLIKSQLLYQLSYRGVILGHFRRCSLGLAGAATPKV